MKIILSRKGFDSSNGGCPSPILPDGTLLSLPIPSDDNIKFSDLQFKGLNYQDLLKQLNPKEDYNGGCHLDPDIREDIRVDKIDNWQPVFGQMGSAQGLLRNADVSVGDIFIFFGSFRKVIIENNIYRYATKKDTDKFYDYSNIHIIYGYMEVGEILKDKEEIAKYHWHPHSFKENLDKTNNTMYLPSKKLSMNPSLPGCGTLKLHDDRVLTMENKSMATWKEHKFLYPDKIYGNKKNSAKGKGLYYQGIWQELVVYESKELIQWVKDIISI